jgi:hypothetical protein
VVVVEVLVQRHQSVGGDGEAVGETAGGLASEHQQFPTDVVPALETLGAVTAGQVGLDDDAGSQPGIVHAGAHSVDDTDDLVTGAVGQVDERMAPACRVEI